MANRATHKNLAKELARSSKREEIERLQVNRNLRVTKVRFSSTRRTKEQNLPGGIPRAVNS